MLIAHVILAALALGLLAVRPRSAAAALGVVAAGAVDVGLGAPLAPALAQIAPLVAFLAAALSLAALVERSGLAERAAAALAAWARGNGLALYGLVCAVCAVLTAIVSLDGAVVLMVPVLMALRRRAGIELAPFLLGVVAVANAASVAVPQGNPTNLVVIDRLGLSSAGFLAHMLIPGIAAALICGGGVALAHRRTLARPYHSTADPHARLTRAEGHAVAALAGAALVAWLAPLAGVAPWWPFAGAVALALALRREWPVVPWRIAAQVGGLLVAVGALSLHPSASATPGLIGLVAVAVGVGAAAALANNLPVSVSAATLLGAAQPAYAASIGLAVGSLATPHGSVATLIATDLAGARGPSVRAFAPLALGAVALATVLLWAMP